MNVDERSEESDKKSVLRLSESSWRSANIYEIWR